MLYVTKQDMLDLIEAIYLESPMINVDDFDEGDMQENAQTIVIRRRIALKHFESVVGKPYDIASKEEIVNFLRSNEWDAYWHWRTVTLIDMIQRYIGVLPVPTDKTV